MISFFLERSPEVKALEFIVKVLPSKKQKLNKINIIPEENDEKMKLKRKFDSITNEDYCNKINFQFNIIINSKGTTTYNFTTNKEK